MTKDKLVCRWAALALAACTFGILALLLPRNVQIALSVLWLMAWLSYKLGA